MGKSSLRAASYTLSPERRRPDEAALPDRSRAVKPIIHTACSDFTSPATELEVAFASNLTIGQHFNVIAITSSTLF
jgi:hypothetical protein